MNYIKSTCSFFKKIFYKFSNEMNSNFISSEYILSNLSRFTTSLATHSTFFTFIPAEFIFSQVDLNSDIDCIRSKDLDLKDGYDCGLTNSDIVCATNKIEFARSELGHLFGFSSTLDSFPRECSGGDGIREYDPKRFL